MKNKLMKQEIRETRKLIVYILAYMAVACFNDVNGGRCGKQAFYHRL